MKNIKLSDEDKKIINKYNHLLMAVVGDDGLFADAYASQDENIYDFSGLYSRKSNELIQTQNEGYKLLSSIIEDFFTYMKPNREFAKKTSDLYAGGV